MMPAIGFAILINVIGKRSILPFFFIGFFIVKIFGCSALQLACLGILGAAALATPEQPEVAIKTAFVDSESIQQALSRQIAKKMRDTGLMYGA